MSDRLILTHKRFSATESNDADKGRGHKVSKVIRQKAALRSLPTGVDEIGL
jgi:hypothetical protein